MKCKWIESYFKNSEYDQEIPQSQTADNPVVTLWVYIQSNVSMVFKHIESDI